MPQRSESRDLDKVIVRLPDGMRDQLKAAAKDSGRSMNAEIVARLEAFEDLRSEKATLERKLLDTEARAERAEFTAKAQRETNEKWAEILAKAEASGDSSVAVSDLISAIRTESEELLKLNYDIALEQDELLREQSEMIRRLASSLSDNRRILSEIQNAFGDAAAGDETLLRSLVELAVERKGGSRK